MRVFPSSSIPNNTISLVFLVTSWALHEKLHLVYKEVIILLLPVLLPFLRLLLYEAVAVAIETLVLVLQLAERHLRKELLLEVFPRAPEVREASQQSIFLGSPLVPLSTLLVSVQLELVVALPLAPAPHESRAQMPINCLTSGMLRLPVLHECEEQLALLL